MAMRSGKILRQAHLEITDQEPYAVPSTSDAPLRT